MANSLHGDKSGCALCCTQIEGLTVKNILRDVKLHLHCGELTAIIGPNGAGKSTLLKTLVGEMPYTGKISFHNSAQRQFSKPKTGYVPQNPNFAPDLPVSVYDLFVASKGYPVWLPIKRKMRREVTEALQRTDSCHLIDRQIGHLSGGEAQRVMLALALAPLPELLLLDEPFSGVDEGHIQGFYALIDSLRSKYDLSIVMVSHDMEYIKKYADRVVLLNKTVIASGAPHEVFASAEYQKIYQGGV